jgi:hypothetical protein
VSTVGARGWSQGLFLLIATLRLRDARNTANTATKNDTAEPTYDKKLSAGSPSRARGHPNRQSASAVSAKSAALKMWPRKNPPDTTLTTVLANAARRRVASLPLSDTLLIAGFVIFKC